MSICKKLISTIVLNAMSYFLSVITKFWSPLCEWLRQPDLSGFLQTPLPVPFLYILASPADILIPKTRFFWDMRFSRAAIATDFRTPVCRRLIKKPIWANLDQSFCRWSKLVTAFPAFGGIWFSATHPADEVKTSTTSESVSGPGILFRLAHQMLLKFTITKPPKYVGKHLFCL